MVTLGQATAVGKRIVHSSCSADRFGNMGVHKLLDAGSIRWAPDRSI